MTTTMMMQVSLDPEMDNSNLKIGPKNTMEIAILNDDDPGGNFEQACTVVPGVLTLILTSLQSRCGNFDNLIVAGTFAFDKRGHFVKESCGKVSL